MMEQVRLATTKHLQAQCHFAYLLGSAGTKRFTDTSDVDLAAFFKNVPSISESHRITEDLQEALKRDVDLVVLNTIDPIFARQVLETGRLLFADQTGYHLQWKAHQLSLYPDFKTSREVIEKSLLNRKKHV